MLVQGGSPHFAKRVDPIAQPSASGISGDAIASETVVSTTGLAIDAGATGGPTPPPAVFTVIQSLTNSQTSPTQSPGVVSSGSSKSISMSTVIGSCVGAFIGVSALIIIFIWFYRRYSDSLKRQARVRIPLTHGRNVKTDKERRRSRLETWNKLEDGADKWDDRTKEVDQVVPMEKLTMFKRGASIRTAYTQRSVDGPLTYPQSFAPFDSNLVRTLSADNTAVPHPQPSQHPNPIQSQSPSNLSASIPNLNMAIPTPEATVLQPHKWESAEVVHYTEGQSAEVVEPSHQDKNARSTENPFLSPQDYGRSISDSKGKERMDDSLIPSNPFEAQIPAPPIFVHHQATDSSVSTQSKDRALQALMVALELSEDEVRERLRVASMQPSVISQMSQYSTEEEFLNNFRLPLHKGNLGKS